MEAALTPALAASRPGEGSLTPDSSPGTPPLRERRLRHSGAVLFRVPPTCERCVGRLPVLEWRVGRLWVREDR